MGEGYPSIKVMEKVPIGIEHVVFALKIKQPKVSAVRDFLPRCGKVTAPSSRS
ncbi:hypothetical protein J1N35_013945, partial [Gossypium stocksii]